ATRFTSTDPSSGTTTYYVVTLGGSLTSSNVKRIAAAGGFSVDFGASLGSLAGVQTTGDIIPLATLLAQATFGVDLSPSQNLDVGPVIFQPGPRVDVTTTQQGGKSITVSALRPGVLNTTGEIQVLTVRSDTGGQFSLSFDANHDGTIGSGESAAGIAYNVLPATLESTLGGLNTLSGNVHVSKAANPNGNVYTITFDDSPGDVPLLAADGSALVARNERQLVTPANVTGGTFTLSFAGQTTGEIAYSATAATIAGSIQAALRLLSQIGSAGVDVTPSSDGSIVEFKGALSGTDVGPMVDAPGLQGPQQTGVLTGTANFSASLSNSGAVIVLPIQDSVSNVEPSIRDRGDRALGVSPVTNASATA